MKSSPGSLLGPNCHRIPSLFLFSLGLSLTVSFSLCSTLSIPGLCNTLAPPPQGMGWAGSVQTIQSPVNAPTTAAAQRMEGKVSSWHDHLKPPSDQAERCAGPSSGAHRNSSTMLSSPLSRRSPQTLHVPHSDSGITRACGPPTIGTAGQLPHSDLKFQ